MPDTADDAGADGIRVDRDGRLYVTTRMGIQVCDQAGRVNCIIPTPNGRIANLCFGGAGFSNALRHLRRSRLQAEGQGQRGERLRSPDQARGAPVVSLQHGEIATMRQPERAAVRDPRQSDQCQHAQIGASS